MLSHCTASCILHLICFDDLFQELHIDLSQFKKMFCRVLHNINELNSSPTAEKIKLKQLNHKAPSQCPWEVKTCLRWKNPHPLVSEVFRSRRQKRCFSLVRIKRQLFVYMPPITRWGKTALTIIIMIIKFRNYQNKKNKTMSLSRSLLLSRERDKKGFE